jgi:hypothetical protein
MSSYGPKSQQKGEVASPSNCQKSNQGAQRALLAARLQWAADHGARLAMMVAQPGSTSHRNAERQGFRVAYTRTKWQLRAGPNQPLQPSSGKSFRSVE